MTTSKFSDKAFKCSINAIALLVFTLIIGVLTAEKAESASMLTGLGIILVTIFGISGFVYSLRGLGEPNTWKKIMGLVLNSGLVLLFVLIILANMYDLNKAIN